MAIKVISQKRISDEVFGQMKEHIISGEWAPGTKIPGELELASLFKVSRVSVRDAIQRLVGMGILSIHRGEGTYVSEVLPKDYFNTLLPVLMINGASLPEMLEFRAIIEIESARLASLRADEHDIGRMADSIANMEKYRGDDLKFAEEDLNFHIALAAATRNSVIVKVNAIIHDMLKIMMEKIIGLTGYEGGLYYHRRILEAVRKRDAQAAGELMREHIEVTRDKISKSMGEL
jgi:GntR family transcriptional repressor for pyruvate dehydrogenase complex